MPQSLPLSQYLAPNCRKSRLTDTLEAKFGDGYAQRAPNGINNTKDRWFIEYIWLSESDADIIDAALDAVDGHDYLTWTPYKETVQKKFIVDKDSVTWSYNNGMIKISFNMTQTY